MNKKFSRREAIKHISVVVGGTATAIALPSNWTKPVMDAVVGPAAAKFVSYCEPDGTMVRAGGGLRIPNDPSCPQPSSSTTLFPTS